MKFSRTVLQSLEQVDGLLRGGGADSSGAGGRFWRLVLCTAVFGGGYGLVMGTFSGLRPDHALQLVYSSVKAPLLLLCSFALSLPSFFVLNSLAGLRRDFSEAVRAVAATQAGLTVVLCSFAPFTAVWYLSSADYAAAVGFNGLMFAAACVVAHALLRRHYRPLILRHGRHRWMLACWLVIYCFVSIQLAWVLRPFIGFPGQPTEFFRSNVFQENAYEVVWRLAWYLLTGDWRPGNSS